MSDPTPENTNAAYRSSALSDIKSGMAERMKDFEYFGPFNFYNYLRGDLADLIEKIRSIRPPAVVIAVEGRSYDFDPLVDSNLVVFGVILADEVFRKDDWRESKVEELERWIITSLDKLGPCGHVRLLARETRYYDVSSELDVVSVTFGAEDN